MSGSPAVALIEEFGPVVAIPKESEEKISDALVRAVHDALRREGLIEWVDEVVEDFWSALQQKSGRPSRHLIAGMLVGLAVCARKKLAVHLKNVADVLFIRISDDMRQLLGIETTGRRGGRKDHATSAEYQLVLREFHRILAPFDPWPSTPPPSASRLECAAFLMAADRTERQRRLDRLQELGDRIIQTAWLSLPREVRRTHAYVIDETPVHAYETEGSPEPLEDGSSALDRRGPGWYSREGKPSFVAWGLSMLMLAAQEPVPVGGEREHPTLIANMWLDTPGAQPGANAVRLLESYARHHDERGYLPTDSAYAPNSKAAEYQIPARQMGWTPVFGYRYDQLGLQMTHDSGALLVEGRWYCPGIPKQLIAATKDLRDGRIDEQEYARRIEERRSYEMWRKGVYPDGTGDERRACPALAPANRGARVACENRPESMAPSSQKVVWGRPEGKLPKVCTEKQVRYVMSEGAKYWQELRFGSPMHSALYRLCRSTNEGGNAFAKDYGHGSVEPKGARRVRNKAAQWILIAFQLFASNLRAIDSYVRNSAKDDDGRIMRGPIKQKRAKKPPRGSYRALRQADRAAVRGPSRT